MARKFDAFVFDMDGTLLDTLPDLVDVTNATLGHFGYPAHTTEEILSMVGNGLRSLISQALPQEIDTAKADEAISHWKALYDTQGVVKTAPYEGVVEMLAALKARGKKLAVLSNKYDHGTKLMAQRYFADWMDYAVGEGPVPRKPDPTGLLYVAEKLDVDIARIAYVGDSDVDIRAARNAGAFAISVTWGYQSTERLMALNPDALVSSPSDLLAFA